jgi:hypothetical protein
MQIKTYLIIASVVLLLGYGIYDLTGNYISNEKLNSLDVCPTSTYPLDFYFQSNQPELVIVDGKIIGVTNPDGQQTKLLGVENE